MLRFKVQLYNGKISLQYQSKVIDILRFAPLCNCTTYVPCNNSRDSPPSEASTDLSSYGGSNASSHKSSGGPQNGTKPLDDMSDVKPGILEMIQEEQRVS